jgi:transformation/transcription domain-associated protein
MDLQNCQVSALRLTDDSVDNSVKLAILNELRDGIEIVQSLEYSKYLALLLPVFIQLLKQVDVSFQSQELDQKIRMVVLEICHRLPQSEALKPWAGELIGCLMNVLANDNEDVASLALKVILHY